ncbi:hypothetical protein [Compostimonas suwonensis]|uniref:DUF4232 domain-containing protein n=1 Tax=Compostimonas suwonensis TaxID=1048394 RepID=A0A2M9C513_9MICO|nr:hypothetical protein [Compostimonas suwonensis]PJJ65615.1 hypothetical protein CLV54_0651 [Compostimonas suwonensis]
MSTIKNPVGPQPSKVYWRRRIVVGLGLLAVIVIVVLIIVRPGSGGGSPTPAATTTMTSTPTDPPVPSTSIPTDAVQVDGEPCDPANVQVAAITDADSYDPGVLPQLSLSITNSGAVSCVIDAGTAAQVFTITSGDEQYWTSTDCQTDPVSTEVTLEPGQTLSSSVPVQWDRTRSAADTCDATDREQVTGGGASYFLTTSVGGIESPEAKQFLLN